MTVCPEFNACNIIVIGDAMLDRYWHGDTSRISPEAPVPVVKIDRHEERVGGAANVAINVRALGANTSIVAAIGDDEAGDKLTTLLSDKGVHCQFVKSADFPTVLKLRVLGRNQQLIRLDFEEKHKWGATGILEQIKRIASPTDVLILSDYAKGVLAESKAIIAYAREQGMTILVDPKSADFSVYKGAHVLTPNMSEFELAVGHCESQADIERKGFELVDSLELDALLVTRGSQGMTLLEKGQGALHIPAQAKEVFDITGAGDTVIAVLGACLAAKAPLSNAAKLANVAAGMAVGRLGTATISYQELQDELHHEKVGSLKGVVDLPTLVKEVKRRQVTGEKVVMTNGCFDILHAGHITYLQQARDLGDCLIIAVNDDASVKRLKGPQRPVNDLNARMQLLAALRCVDLVVSFSQDTPRELIKTVLPDILVKGGDYAPQEVAGGQEVVANGGEVKILSFVPGYSTTQTLEKLALETTE